MRTSKTKDVPLKEFLARDLAGDYEFIHSTDLLKAIQKEKIKTWLRTYDNGYSDTLVFELPKKSSLKQIRSLIILRPDDVYIEKGKLVLWWD